MPSIAPIGAAERIDPLDVIREWLLNAHRFVGYPLVFLVGPLALYSLKGGPEHRRWGKLYFWVMLYLYATGSVMTFRHELGSWVFFRNVTFNFFGFSMVLYAYRSIWLRARGGVERAERIDWLLNGILLLVSLGMLAVGLADVPMLVFGGLGLLLWAFDLYELLSRFDDRRVLYNRHVRYILCSFFYVVTVVSLVHVNRPHNKKWLWPLFVAVPVILLTSDSVTRWLRANRTRMLENGIRVALAATYGLGLYVLYAVGQTVNRWIRVVW